MNHRSATGCDTGRDTPSTRDGKQGAVRANLVLGAGVIGSVYAAKLLQAGHEVVLLARGRRLADLRAYGLILEEATSRQRTVLPVTAVGVLDPDDQYDLVLVQVRSEQLASAFPVLTGMRDGSHVLFFGNTGGRHAAARRGLSDRALCGFPRPGASGTGQSSDTC